MMWDVALGGSLVESCLERPSGCPHIHRASAHQLAYIMANGPKTVHCIGQNYSSSRTYTFMGPKSSDLFAQVPSWVAGRVDCVYGGCPSLLLTQGFQETSVSINLHPCNGHDPNCPSIWAVTNKSPLSLVPQVTASCWVLNIISCP